MDDFELLPDYRLSLKPASIIGMGDGLRYIYKLAEKFCRGKGLDVGASMFKSKCMSLPGAIPVDTAIHGSGSAEDLSQYHNAGINYILSSHCLEHLSDPELAVREARKVLSEGGIFFLYLPFPGHHPWDPLLNSAVRSVHKWQPTPLAINRLLLMNGFKIEYAEWDKDILTSFVTVGRAC